MSLRHLLPITAIAALAACYVPEGGSAEAAPGAQPEVPAEKPVLQQAAGPVEPARKLQTAPGGTVTVEVVPQYDAVFVGDRELNVLLRLTGTGDAPAQRPPLDLALVIDRSGSMSGDKLRSVKEAALKLLQQLGPDDRVSLSTYGSEVTTLTTRLPVDDRGRAVLRDYVLGIRSDGMTALGPAMARALEALEAGVDGGAGSRLAHVLLLSDGIANVGESRPAALGARAAQGFTHGVTVSTLGVGLDYNEDLMTKLADQGGGRYHFVKDDAETAKVLQDEMSGLVATVARSVEVELAAAPGAEVLRVFGYPLTTRDGIAQIRVGTLGAGQTREIVLRMRLPEGGAGTLDLGKLAVRFSDLPADGVARRIDVPVAVRTTHDKAEATASERPEVSVRVAEVESAAQLEMAARAADRGDFAGAGSSLQVAIDDLEKKQAAKPSPKLARQLMDLKEARGELEEAQQSSAGRKGYTKKFKAKAYKARKR